MGMTRSGTGGILLVANYAPGTGFAWWLMERFWAMAAREAGNEGRRCFIAYPEVGELPPALSDVGIEVVTLDYSDRSRSGTQRLIEFVRQNKVDSIYLTDRAYLDRRYARLRAAGVTTIVIHDHTPGYRPPILGIKGAWKASVHELGRWSADLYVAPTDYIRTRMIANGRLPPERCVVVPNGIIPDCEAEMAGREIRAKFGIEYSDIVVALVSRAHPYKNVDFAIRCAERVCVSTSSRQVKFLFCGDGPQMRELETLASRCGLDGMFLFAGRRADVRQILGACDIGFHPSRGEVGYSLSILEMMASGLPVVVPDDPSVCGATEHEKSGLVYRSGDAAAAIDALTRLVDDEPLRLRLGAHARAVVCEQYDIALTDREFSDRVVSIL